MYGPLAWGLVIGYRIEGCIFVNRFRESRMTEGASSESGQQISDLISYILKKWKFVFGITGLSVLGAFVFLILREDDYSARMIVVASDESSSATGAASTSLSAVAKIAGVGVESGVVSEFEKFKFLLKSERLARVQMESRQIDKLIFLDEWDEASGKWVAPDGVVSRLRSLAAELFGRTFWREPDAFRVAEFYDKNINIRQNDETGLVEVSIVGRSPEFSRQILEYVYQDANEILRNDAEIRATKKAEYLREKLREADNAEYRLNLARLLSVEEQTLTLVSTSLPFAAFALSPPMSSFDPVGLNPVLLVVIVGILAFVAIVTVLGIVFAFRHA